MNARRNLVVFDEGVKAMLEGMRMNMMNDVNNLVAGGNFRPFPQRQKFPPLFGKTRRGWGKGAQAKEKRRCGNATDRCPRCTQPSMAANVLGIVLTGARFKGRHHQTIATQLFSPPHLRLWNIVSLARPVRLGAGRHAADPWHVCGQPGTFLAAVARN